MKKKGQGKHMASFTSKLGYVFPQLKEAASVTTAERDLPGFIYIGQIHVGILESLALLRARKRIDTKGRVDKVAPVSIDISGDRIIGVDNIGAIYISIKGGSMTPLQNATAVEFGISAHESGMRGNEYVFWVGAERNVADAPTRSERHTELGKLSGVEIDFYQPAENVGVNLEKHRWGDRCD